LRPSFFAILRALGQAADRPRYLKLVSREMGGATRLPCGRSRFPGSFSPAAPPGAGLAAFCHPCALWCRGLAEGEGRL